MDKNFLNAGKIVNTHSLKGEVKIYPYCDSADFLGEFDRLYIDGTPWLIKQFRVHKGMALIKFEGINDINAASQLIGKFVFIDKKDIELEPGRFFIEDLLGLDVIDIDTGKNYGKIINVITTGANDVFEVKGEKILLVPKIDDVVKDISIKDQIVKIRPLEGLFE